MGCECDGAAAIVVEPQEVEAVERRPGVPRQADQHVHVGRVQRRHQQVARHPHELEQ